MTTGVNSLARGRYLARLAEGAADLEAAQALRYRCFVDPGGGGRDADPYDTLCAHVLIEERTSGALVCCFRLLPLESGAQISDSYSAQFYALDRLGRFPGHMAELGRFCIAPEVRDADILRVAWGAMTRFVDDRGIEMLFGCASFKGTDPAAYQDSFALLRDRHLAPDRWRPQLKAPHVVRFAQNQHHKADAKRALATMPPLLRTYLLMGGWVSDHAVVDAGLNTLHVFTGLEIAAVPAARARLLRNVAGQGHFS